MRKKNISIIQKVLFFTALITYSFNANCQKMDSSVSVVHYQAKANQMFGLVIEQPDQNQLKFKAVVSNPEGKPLIIEVVDRLHGCVDSRRTDQKLFSVGYDFTHAPDGEYIVSVRSGKVRLKEKIGIQTIIREERVAVYNHKSQVLRRF